MSTSVKLKTTVPDEFLKHQFDTDKALQHAFGQDFEKFKTVMSDAIRSCMYCGLLAWKDCELPCDCAYEQTLKKESFNH